MMKRRLQQLSLLDMVKVRARIRVRLVSSCFFYHNCFEKWLSEINTTQITKERWSDSPGIHWYSLETLQACLQRLQWKPGLSPWRTLSYSVLWFRDSYLNSCTLLNWQNNLFINCFIELKQKETSLPPHGGIVNTCVIRMFCDNNKTLTSTFISNLCVFNCSHGISCSYTSFCYHFGGADSNGPMINQVHLFQGNSSLNS